MACDYSVSIDYSTELMNCEELHAILHLVLQAGNIMNAVSLFLFLYFQCSLPSTPHLPPFCGHFPQSSFHFCSFLSTTPPKHSLMFLNQEGFMAFTALTRH